MTPLRWLLLVAVVALLWAAPASAQTATPTVTPTLTPTPTVTVTPTPTATRTPQADINCGAGPGAGGARATGVCGGLCAIGKVCRWDITSTDAGCICVDQTSDCDTPAGGVGQSMCTQGYCDRPPTMPGGQCTNRGKICMCE